MYVQECIPLGKMCPEEFIIWEAIFNIAKTKVKA